MPILLKKILTLEALSRQLEPPAEVRQAWNDQVAAYAERFIESLSHSPAFLDDDNKGQELLQFPIPEYAVPVEQLIHLVEEAVDKPALNPASGRHFGYIPGGGVFPGALGDYMAAVANNYAGIFYAGPGAVRMENMLIRWMAQFLGYPRTALGNLASGGSIATLVAITTARDTKKLKAAMVENAVVYLTTQVHHCVHKAFRIAGMKEAIFRNIPLDEHFRMDTDYLKRQIALDWDAGLRPFMIIGTAGTTDTGAIDPLDTIADIAQKNEIWFHVDAAYGGFFMLVENLKPAFKGIERSDSVVIDPHKGLFLPYGLGAVIIRDVPAQYQAHFYQANYMQDALSDDHEYSPADLSPELTKHFRGMRMWLPLQLFGVSPFRASLQEKALLCRYFYEEIQKRGFEVGPEPELSVMIFRHPGSDEANQHLIKHVQHDGRVFVSSTTIQDKFWIRMAVMSFRTHLPEIELALQILEESAYAMGLRQ
ncbi:MAG: aminotransferase class V-fold PLP-dependent enzyme [Saprospiraceae bacterium]|nr:aminotransferase class V-fold PLP-dependent enzyme [Saprospiraceae bacterium]